MLDGVVEKKIVDGKVFVNFDDLISALFNIIDDSLTVAELTGDKTLTIQITGIIELVKKMDSILDEIKTRNGLARFR